MHGQQRSQVPGAQSASQIVDHISASKATDVVDVIEVAEEFVPVSRVEHASVLVHGSFKNTNRKKPIHEWNEKARYDGTAVCVIWLSLLYSTIHSHTTQRICVPLA